MNTDISNLTSAVIRIITTKKSQNIDTTIFRRFEKWSSLD